MNVKIFQFNGCNKCFNETILLKKQSDVDVEYIFDPKGWSAEKFDMAIITGYLTPEDKETLLKIGSNTEKLIAYGDCTTTGGIFGLANQHGKNIQPISKFLPEVVRVNGCLAEIEELTTVIKDGNKVKAKLLCKVCKRRSTCDYLTQVNRQIDPSVDEKSCFNDLGFLCNGYIAAECKERCVDYGTQCRGCKPLFERSGIRMLGMFGTLMGNVDVATEASNYGATDKLSDEDDDMTESLPDIIGNFFRFTLPTSGLPKGRIPSKGTIVEDVFTGRLIEEFPLITGLLGGDKAISMTLSIIEAYEKGANIEVSEETKKYREELRKLEKQLQKSVKEKDADKYKAITDDIRKIAGNMNLSNVFFGGFKTPITESDNFESYKSKPFEVKEGNYTNGLVEFTLDSLGVIKKIKIREAI